MFQWLGLDPFTAEGLGSIPGGGPINKNLYTTQRGQKINKMCLLKNFLSVYVCWCIKENSFFFSSGHSYCQVPHYLFFKKTIIKQYWIVQGGNKLFFQAS